MKHELNSTREQEEHTNCAYMPLIQKDLDFQLKETIYMESQQTDYTFTPLKFDSNIPVLGSQ